MSNRATGKGKIRQRVKIDLVDVIDQAASQVWGSDERELLYRWLDRNTEAAQWVEIEICIKGAGGSDNC